MDPDIDPDPYHDTGKMCLGGSMHCPSASSIYLKQYRQIVFGLSVLKCHKFFQLSGRSTTRGHRFKLMKQQCRGYRRHFFTTRVVNIWNFLPKDLVSFSTLCSFKNSLNSVDFLRFLSFR